MNSQAWKRHFVDMARGKFRDKPFYQLETQHGGGSPIQMVTPTQQAIEMARSQEKQQQRIKLKKIQKKKKKATINRRVAKKIAHSK